MNTRRLQLAALLMFLVLGWLCPAQSGAQSDPPLVVLINALNYDPAQNTYQVSVSVNSPQLVHRLLVSVEDAEAGIFVISSREVNLGGFSSRQVPLDGKLFQAEHKYRLTIQAVHAATRTLIPRVEDNPSNDPEQQYILASKEFTHQPPEAPKFAFTIDSVNADFKTGRLLIMLYVPPNHPVLKYDGFMVDDTGQRVADFAEALYPGSKLDMAIPDKLRQAQQERKYKVRLNLYTQDDQQAQAEYELVLAPPPKPGLLERIWIALRENPVILLLIVVVLSAVATVIILFTKKPSTGLPPLPRPPIDHTQDVYRASSRNRLRIRIIQTPGSGRGNEKTVTQFPCFIGRDKDCVVSIDDKHVSAKHLQITLQEGQFYATDISRNGSFINSNNTMLTPNKPRHISGVVDMRLGDQTIIEIDTGD